MFALVKASRLVRADATMQAMFRQRLLEGLLELRFASRVATSSRIRLFALVTANEDMFAEFGHELR
jgi:hypothetical protein